jgi:hypothetical protein
MMYFSQPNINDLEDLNQHMVCVLNAPSSACTQICKGKEINNADISTS